MLRRTEILQVCLSETRKLPEGGVKSTEFDKGELKNAFNVAQLWAIYTVVNYKNQRGAWDNEGRGIMRGMG